MPGKNASPIGARMPSATTCTSEPSGSNEITDADHCVVDVQWSHGAEMPTYSRPSFPCVMPLTSPVPSGTVSTVVRVANAVPSNPLRATMPPVSDTYSVSPTQSSPRGVWTSVTTFTGCAPASVTR